jgi:hypothetical protein
MSPLRSSWPLITNLTQSGRNAAERTQNLGLESLKTKLRASLTRHGGSARLLRKLGVLARTLVKLCGPVAHSKARMKELTGNSKFLLLPCAVAGGMALGTYWYMRRRRMDEEDQKAWKEERACLNVLGVETRLNGFEIAIGNGVISRREKNSKKLRPGSLKQAALDAITSTRGYSYVEIWGSNGFALQRAKQLLDVCSAHEASERITQAANHLAASLMYRQDAARAMAQQDDVCTTLKIEIGNTEIALRRLTKTDPSLRSRWGPVIFFDTHIHLLVFFLFLALYNHEVHPSIFCCAHPCMRFLLWVWRTNLLTCTC